MSLTLTNCRTLLDSALQRSGSGGTYTSTDKDAAIRMALDWANVDGWLLRNTADLSIKPNDIKVAFSGVSNFDSSQFIDARITGDKTSLNPAGSASWVDSSATPGEYYYHKDGASTTDPELREPDVIWDTNAAQAAGTLGSLSNGQWAWGDQDSAISFNTVYFKVSGGDPDTVTDGTIEAGYFDDPVVLRGFNSIREMHLNNGSSLDRPKFIGFSTKDEAEIWPQSDDFYQMRVRYKASITDFAVGTGSPSSVTFDIPEQYIHPIITWGAASIAMAGDPNVHTQSGMWAEFKNWVRIIKGSGVDPGPTYKVAAD